MSRARGAAPIALAVALAALVGGCGHDAKKKPATTTTPTTTQAAKAPPAAPQLVQQARAIAPGKPASGGKPATPGKAGKVAKGRVQATPGSTVLLFVSVPPSAEGKQVTITMSKTTGRDLPVITTVGGQQRTTKIAGRDGPIRILDVRYNCSVPTPTFCPLTSAVRQGGAVHLTLKATSAQIVLNIPIGRSDEALPAVRLLSRGLPSPGAPVDATASVRTVGKGVKAALPGPSASARPGNLVQLQVRPAPGSPERGILRIGITRTSGKSIAIQVGGSASKPSSSVTVDGARGRIRIVSVGWSCRLPPATFCPFRAVNRTASGLVMIVRNPPVPILLTLKIDRA